MSAICAFCPACGERVRKEDPHVRREDVRWHLDCVTDRLSVNSVPLSPLSVRCPICSAEPGIECADPNGIGYPGSWHQDRWRVAMGYQVVPEVNQ